MVSFDYAKNPKGIQGSQLPVTGMPKRRYAPSFRRVGYQVSRDRRSFLQPHDSAQTGPTCLRYRERYRNRSMPRYCSNSAYRGSNKARSTQNFDVSHFDISRITDKGPIGAISYLAEPAPGPVLPYCLDWMHCYLRYVESLQGHQTRTVYIAVGLRRKRYQKDSDGELWPRRTRTNRARLSG